MQCIFLIMLPPSGYSPITDTVLFSSLPLTLFKHYRYHAMEISYDEESEVAGMR
jgi:hypothetical protein